MQKDNFSIFLFSALTKGENDNLVKVILIVKILPLIYSNL